MSYHSQHASIDNTEIIIPQPVKNKLQHLHIRLPLNSAFFTLKTFLAPLF